MKALTTKQKLAVQLQTILKGQLVKRPHSFLTPFTIDIVFITGHFGDGSFLVRNKESGETELFSTVEGLLNSIITEPTLVQMGW